MIISELALNNNNGRSFRQTANLSGTLYILEFRWNPRSQQWFLDMYDLNKIAVINGAALCTDWPILIHCSSAIKPSGQLMLIDTSGKGAPCTARDLGGRYKLVYVTGDNG